MTGLFEKAVVLATISHGLINQKRKYTNEPYITHPLAVAAILRDHGIVDENVLAAAVCHDLIEDPKLTSRQIEIILNTRVAELTVEVTDVSSGLQNAEGKYPKEWNRAKRKALDRQHYWQSSRDGASIKCADCLHNGKDIEVNDPNFAVVYFKEMGELLPGLAHASCRAVWQKATDQVAAYYAKRQTTAA